MLNKQEGNRLTVALPRIDIVLVSMRKKHKQTFEAVESIKNQVPGDLLPRIKTFNCLVPPIIPFVKLIFHWY